MALCARDDVGLDEMQPHQVHIHIHLLDADQPEHCVERNILCIHTILLLIAQDDLWLLLIVY